MVFILVGVLLTPGFLVHLDLGRFIRSAFGLTAGRNGLVKGNRLLVDGTFTKVSSELVEATTELV